MCSENERSHAIVALMEEISEYIDNPNLATKRKTAINLLIKNKASTDTSYDLLNQKIESYSSEKENFETSKYYKDIILPVFELLKSKQLQSN